MSQRPFALLAAAFVLVLFSAPALADGNLVRSDITQVRYMLEKYAANDPSTYCIRAATLADANPSLREEINRETRTVAQRHGIADCSGAAVAMAPPPVMYQQPAPPPVIYQQPVYTPPASTYTYTGTQGNMTTTAASVGTGTRITGSHGSILLGSSLLWGGLGLIAAGGIAAALFTTDVVGGEEPTPTGCNDFHCTDEYKAQYSLTTMDAASAYRRGFKGDGIKIGFVDTGLDISHFEFEGRVVSGGGFDFVTNQAGQPSSGNLFSHGTQVAGVALANRNFIGMHGVAYNAIAVPARVFDVNGAPIANFTSAINFITNSGARILNGSYGPNDSWHVLAESRGHQILPAVELQEAAAFQDFAAAGGILIFPTGNAFQIAPNIASNPTGPGFLPFIRPANSAITGAANGAYRDTNGDELSTADFSDLEDITITVAGVDKSNTILAFSNRCGVAADWCMVAPAVDIFTTTTNNQYAIVTGTSYAAPQVSGAIAILRQEFPNLTAAEIVDRLFDTATDLGTAGVDAIYGHGLLNLARASMPLGFTGIATTGNINGPKASFADSSLRFSSAFGIAAANFMDDKHVLFLDRQNAAFVTGARNLVNVRADDFSAEDAFYRFDRPEARSSLKIGENMSASFIIDRSNDRTSRFTGSRPKDPTDTSGDVRDMSVTQKFSDTLSTSMHYRDADNMALGFSEGDRPRFERAIDKRGLENPYAAFAGEGYATVLKTEGLGGTLRVAGFFGHDEADEDATNFGSLAEATYSLADKSEATISVGSLFEDNRVLGSRGEGAFTFGKGTSTIYSGVGTKLSLDSKTTLHAAGYAGFTDPSLSSNSLIKDASAIITSSFNAGVERSSVMKKDDSFGFSVSQPLRVESGSLGFALPVLLDAGNNSLIMSGFTQDLAANGREMDMEVNYAYPLGEDGRVSAGALYRHDAGHKSGNQDTMGVLRWAKQF